MLLLCFGRRHRPPCPSPSATAHVSQRVAVSRQTGRRANARCSAAGGSSVKQSRGFKKGQLRQREVALAERKRYGHTVVLLCLAFEKLYMQMCSSQEPHGLPYVAMRRTMAAGGPQWQAGDMATATSSVSDKQSFGRPPTSPLSGSHDHMLALAACAPSRFLLSSSDAALTQMSTPRMFLFHICMHGQGSSTIQGRRETPASLSSLHQKRRTHLLAAHLTPVLTAHEACALNSSRSPFGLML